MFNHLSSKKLILYLIAFISGFAMMAYEILGVRVLSPFYGSSVYVWGAIISVFLAGLSIGYAVGGRIADHRSDGKTLALLVLPPALLILLFPIYGYGLSNLIYSFEMDSRLGALLLSGLLFFVPSIFMGSVLPIIIEILAKTSHKAGSAAGNVYAASTAGSIIGTLFTSFWLISWIGVSSGIMLIGALLCINLILCLAYRSN
jgi:predicted membrane-bound spermidine synthase